MSITSRIIGTDGQQLKINQEGDISVTIHQHPPITEDILALPFRSYFTDDGTTTGSNDMAVNGGTTNVDFYIKASETYDIYIKYISVEIGDGGSPALNKFGELPELTDGIAFYWDTQQEPFDPNADDLDVATECAHILGHVLQSANHVQMIESFSGYLRGLNHEILAPLHAIACHAERSRRYSNPVD